MVGAALLASAYSWPQLVAGRLVMGLGVGLATQATPPYLMEMSPAQWRGEWGC
jgi:MFS family permease